MLAHRRKEKAKFAARARRGQESEIFIEMAKELSISYDQLQRIDKASILRMAISYIKSIKALNQLSSISPARSTLLPLAGNNKSCNPVFTSHHSLDFKFIYIDDSVRQFVDYEPQLLVGKSLLQFIHVFDTQQLNRSYQAILSKGHTQTGYYRFIAKYGGFVWLLTEASIVNGNEYGEKAIIECNNHVLSGIKDKSIILTSEQIPRPASSKSSLSSLSSSSSSSSSSPPTFIVDIKNNTTDTDTDSDTNTDSYLQTITSRNSYPIIETGTTTDIVRHQSNHYPDIDKYTNNNNNISSDTDKSANIDEITNANPDTIAHPDTDIHANAVSDSTIDLDTADTSTTTSDTITYSETNRTDTDININKGDTDSDTVTIAVTDSSVVTETTTTTSTRNITSTGTITKPSKPTHSTDLLPNSVPQLSTFKIFAPKTDDMNSCFLMINDEDGAAVLLPDSQVDKEDDLTHLAPQAGDISVPLDVEPLDDIILDQDSPFLSSSVGILDNENDPIVMNCGNITTTNNVMKKWDRGLQANESFLTDEDLQACMMGPPFSSDIGLDFDQIDNDGEQNCDTDKLDNNNYDSIVMINTIMTDHQYQQIHVPQQVQQHHHHRQTSSGHQSQLDFLNQQQWHKTSHQPPPNQQQITNPSRHSVLLNLLVDGSDIAAGYTSKNSRAVIMKQEIY